MKHKFKIGDKVRVLDGSNIRNYTGGWYEYMNKYVGKEYTIVKVCTFQGRTSYNLENCRNENIPFMVKFDERGLELAEDKDKFKVGDMVIGNEYADGTYGITKSGWKGQVVNVNASGTFDARGIGFTNTATFHCLLPECFDLVETKVVITYVENMTIAKYYENGNCVKTGVAKCSPEDTFDFGIGAKIAFNRLFGFVEPILNNTFDWESFKKGEICVLCNEDNYKDFLKAAKENDCNVGNYGDNLFKNQIVIKKILGLSLKYKDELLPGNEIIFIYEENVVKISSFKDDKTVKW